MELDFMKEAIQEALCGISQNHGGPFGAVIVKDNQIVARSHNQVLLKKDPTAHGEMEAIRAACKVLNTHDLSGCVIYTTGYPCPMCLSAIRWANISKVYYGCRLEDTDAIGFRDLSFQSPPDSTSFFSEVGRSECLSLYNYYKSLNPKLY